MRALSIVLALTCAGGCKLSAGGGNVVGTDAGSDAGSDGADAAVCEPASCPSLRIVKSIGASGREFSTIAQWQAARRGNLITRNVLRVESIAGVFEVGENVATGACSGRFVPEGAGSGDVLTLDDVTGDCTPGDVFTGEASGASATLVGTIGAGTIEVGELFADDVFAENVVIAGSSTDAEHHVVLTVAETDRHSGLAGTGAVIDPITVEHGIHIGDAFTVVEWVEVTDWGTDLLGSYDGINIQADQVLVQNVIVHDDGHGIELNSDHGGIQVGAPDITATVRNSIVYNIARLGIGIHEGPNATLNVENCTVFRCVEADNSPNSYACIGITGTTAPTSNPGAVLNVVNSIAAERALGANSGVFHVGDDASFATVSNNVSDDESAPGAGSRINVLSGAQFVSTDRGAENLHLTAGSDAIGAGVNLSSRFAADIDGDARPAEPAAWDVGADQR